MEIKKGLAIKQSDEVVGNEVIVKITKNKVAPPHKEAKVAIMYGLGISHVTEVFDMAIEKGICNKSGAWFSFGNERLGQGKVNVENMLRENEALFKEIEAKVYETLNIKPNGENQSEDTKDSKE